MERDIAQQIAELINTQNKLTVHYDANKILSNANRYIYRVIDGSVAGVIELKKVQWYQCEIDHLSVHPSVRRQGVASSLLDEALSRAVQLGARIAQCTISVGNEESEGFFAKHGFTSTITFRNEQNGNHVKALVS